jgi:hypothetical protein
MIAIEDIKREAQARILDVLGALGVREKPSAGGYISMCNPLIKDRHPSFTIWVRGPAIGAFKDHRDDGPGGTRGDIIDLVAYLSGWWQRPKKGRPEAIRFLIDLLGLERVDGARLAQDRALARKRQAEIVKKRDEELAAKQARAFALFVGASSIIDGTPVDFYLRGRGIALEALPPGPRGGRRRPHAIRYLTNHLHTESDKSGACMIAACVNAWGVIRAVHRTWIMRDGAGGWIKADCVPNKKVWPSFAGLIIPLWRGETNIGVKEAIAAGLRETLVLTEGIEDGLSAVIAAPQYRTWAFIALGNLGNVVLPECIDGVIVHRQNEWENRVAVGAFNRGKRALEAQGRPVMEAHAMYGKDLNDMLRGVA